MSESRYDEDYTRADFFAGRTGESEDRLRAGGNRLRRWKGETGYESTDNEADRHNTDRDRTGGSVLHDRYHEQPWRSDGTGFCARSNLVCGDVRRSAFARKG